MISMEVLGEPISLDTLRTNGGVSMAETDQERNARRAEDRSARTRDRLDEPGAGNPVGADRDGDLSRMESVSGQQPGTRYLRRVQHPDFRRIKPGYIVPRPGVVEPESAFGRAYARLKRFLIGRPLATVEEAGERVGKFVGLAIFASDNISSSAYATEEIMRVLILA